MLSSALARRALHKRRCGRGSHQTATPLVLCPTYLHACADAGVHVLPLEAGVCQVLPHSRCCCRVIDQVAGGRAHLHQSTAAAAAARNASPIRHMGLRHAGQLPSQHQAEVDPAKLLNHRVSEATVVRGNRSVTKCSPRAGLLPCTRWPVLLCSPVSQSPSEHSCRLAHC